MRCIVLIVIIVGLAAVSPFFAVTLFVITSLASLGYGIHERQWTYYLLNLQTTINEALLYGIGSLMLICRLECPALEPVILIFIGALLSNNIFIVTYAGLKACRLCIMKLYRNNIIGKLIQRMRVKTAQVKALE